MTTEKRAKRGLGETEIAKVVTTRWVDAADVVVAVCSKSGVNAHTVQKSIIRMAERGTLEATRSSSGRFIQQIRLAASPPTPTEHIPAQPKIKSDLRALVDMHGDFVIGKGDVVLHLSRDEVKAVLHFWSSTLK